VSQQTPSATSRPQRILSFIIAALVVVSLLCIVAILIGTAVGGFAQQGSGQGVWPAVFVLPLIALPIAFVLMIVLFVLTARSRSKAAKAQAAIVPPTKGKR
jgi:TRAP-type C4-dicarboxylate transport system permease small subunit